MCILNLQLKGVGMKLELRKKNTRVISNTPGRERLGCFSYPSVNLTGSWLN